jgi:hypothetical protein
VKLVCTVWPIYWKQPFDPCGVVKAACSSDVLDLNPVRCSQSDEVIARNLRPRFPQGRDTTSRFRQNSSVEFTSVWLRNSTRLPDVRAVGRTKTLSAH